MADAQPGVGRLELPMPQTLLVQGQYAYIFKHTSESDPLGALYVVDVSQPDTPTLVGQTEAGDVGVAHFRDNHLYVTEGDGVSVFDVSIPSNPHRVGHVAIPEGPNRLRQVAGNYLYLSYRSDLQVIDISDPTLPTLVATFGRPALPQLTDCYLPAWRQITPLYAIFVVILEE